MSLSPRPGRMDSLRAFWWYCQLMKYRMTLLSGGLSMLFCLSALGQSESSSGEVVLDGSELNRQLQDRREKISQLAPEERAALETARASALRDPAVREARKKRDEALRDYELVLIKSMVKGDPTVRPILEKSKG